MLSRLALLITQDQSVQPSRKGIRRAQSSMWPPSVVPSAVSTASPV